MAIQLPANSPEAFIVDDRRLSKMRQKRIHTIERRLNLSFVNGDIHMLYICNSVTSCKKALNDSGGTQEESGQCTGPQPRHKRIANNTSMLRELDKRKFKKIVDIMIDLCCSNLSSYVYQSKNEAEPGRTATQHVQLRSNGTTRADMASYRCVR